MLYTDKVTSVSGCAAPHAEDGTLMYPTVELITLRWARALGTNNPARRAFYQWLDADYGLESIDFLDIDSLDGITDEQLRRIHTGAGTAFATSLLADEVSLVENPVPGHAPLLVTVSIGDESSQSEPAIACANRLKLFHKPVTEGEARLAMIASGS